ncbi:hypothetical protein [Streptomyces sp. NPDC056227]|uniref:hypothetical protein n=1 Tax=Streptomyces sp. NPDC056227 TaxID=3345753 RepID=UPI0035E1EDE4
MTQVLQLVTAPSVVHKGMAADLAVLDRDLFAPDTDVAGTCSVLTPVAGEAVHTE